MITEVTHRDMGSGGSTTHVLGVVCGDCPKEDPGETELLSLAARMVRATDVCEKAHRNGEANPHVHFEVVHGWGVQLTNIRRRLLVAFRREP